MKTFLRNLSFGLISFAFIAILFGGGYFVGKKAEGSNSAPISIVNPADPSKNVDFAAFWKVWNLLDQKFAPASSTQKISNQDRVYGAISGMVSSLKDPYTVFLAPDENQKFEENIQGNFEGIGMEVGVQDDVLTVIAPLKNTPAEKAGIKTGDKIIKIDDISTQSMNLSDAVSKIKGKIGTPVKLTIDRKDLKEPIEISVTRDTIVVPTLDTELRKDGIFVISLYNFSQNSSADFKKALREFYLTKSNKLILDLRGNPGGFLDSAVDIASWFLPVGKVVVKENFGDGQDEKVFRSKGPGLFNENLKMVVLIDGGSASAAEILAGALKQHDVATLVGQHSFGKGSVQELIDVTPETALKVTIAQWLTPNGTSISNGGLTPDAVVENVYADDGKGKLLEDKQLIEAVNILLKK
jgi:carboxyl-terminal processing protease